MRLVLVVALELINQNHVVTLHKLLQTQTKFRFVTNCVVQHRHIRLIKCFQIIERCLVTLDAFKDLTLVVSEVSLYLNQV